MILGINLLTLVISEIKEGEFFITFKIRKKKLMAFMGSLYVYIVQHISVRKMDPMGHYVWILLFDDQHDH
jgi:hypothetical protein